MEEGLDIEIPEAPPMPVNIADPSPVQYEHNAQRVLDEERQQPSRRSRRQHQQVPEVDSPSQVAQWDDKHVIEAYLYDADTDEETEMGEQVRIMGARQVADTIRHEVMAGKQEKRWQDMLEFHRD